MKATVEWQPRKVKSVILELDMEEYHYLISCLDAHANNNIENGRVLNCGTAKTILIKILDSVGN